MGTKQRMHHGKHHDLNLCFSSDQIPRVPSTRAYIVHGRERNVWYWEMEGGVIQDREEFSITKSHKCRSYYVDNSPDEITSFVKHLIGAQVHARI